MRTASFIAVLSIAIASPALAQPNAAPAKAAPVATSDSEKISLEYFEKGQKLVAQKKYLDALAAFSAGYELSRRPLFLFNMAESARFAGNDGRARELYTRYLSEDPNGKMVGMAQQRLSTLGGPLPSEPMPAGPPGAQSPKPANQPAPTLTTGSSVPPPSVAAASYEQGHVSYQTDHVEPSRPIYKRPVFWVGVGAAVAVVATVVIISASSGGGEMSCTAGCADLR